MRKNSNAPRRSYLNSHYVILLRDTVIILIVSQIKAKQEAEMRRAEAEAARWARLEAERVTEEILAEVGHSKLILKKTLGSGHTDLC